MENSTFNKIFYKNQENDIFVIWGFLLGAPACFFYLYFGYPIPHEELTFDVNVLSFITLITTFLFIIAFFSLLCVLAYSLKEYALVEKKEKTKTDNVYILEYSIDTISIIISPLSLFLALFVFKGNLGVSLTYFFLFSNLIVPLLTSKFSPLISKALLKEKKSEKIPEIKSKLSIPFEKTELISNISLLKNTSDALDEEVKKQCLILLENAETLILKKENLSFETKHMIKRMLQNEIPLLLTSYIELSTDGREKLKEDMLKRLHQMNAYLERELMLLDKENLEKIQKAMDVIGARYDKEYH